MLLVPIERTGTIATKAKRPDILEGVVAQTCSQYERAGFASPWHGYVGIEGEAIVGTCAFVAAPADGEVEIAYFTFPPNEGRGVATRMAQKLIEIAAAAAPNMTVKAHTLPQENASTAILRKLGFDLDGVIEHPEDGTIWRWTRPQTA